MSWKYRSGGPRGYHHGNLKEALLRAASADLVVTSLDQVDTAAVPGGILRTRP